MAAQRDDDVRAIEAIIARQFQSMNWPAGGTGDWPAFAADFFPDASLYPAARPARRQGVEDFIERMQGLSEATLRSFRQTILGAQVHVFGNVAVALGVCENLENDSETSRGIEAFLLIKDAGAWRIVAQSWDTEGEGKTIPPELLHGDL